MSVPQIQNVCFQFLNLYTKRKIQTLGKDKKGFERDAVDNTNLQYQQILK